MVGGDLDSARTVVQSDSATKGRPEPPGSPDRPPVRSFGRFEVVGLLGRGGMGRVWRARDPRLDREVAIKEILGDHPELVARFLDEARAQARVSHPHVCTVYEVGETDGRPFIAMELLDAQCLDRVAPDLGPEEKVEIMRQVAEAVHAAHRTGLIHRDIKPANIMVGRTESGEWWPWVTDFGLARRMDGPGLTIDGQTMGTPSFMPPEQARGENRTLDERADVYSLGATLYAILAGRPPFDGESMGDVIFRVIRDEPPSFRRLGLKVPKDLESIVVQCLEKRPERRYSGADQLAEDLGRFLRKEPVRARPAGVFLRMGKAIRRRRLVASLILVAVVLAVVLGSAWWHAVVIGKEKAVLAAEFDRDVRIVEESVRHTFTAPLHDVRPELDAARARLDRLEKRVAVLGEIAVGPGNAALGRGFLALHDFEAARQHLERAWFAGEHSPEVAVALGRALAALYRERHAKAKWKDREDSTRILGEAQTHLRDPALEMLRKGVGAEAESPELVEAMLALCEGRWDEAVENARAAIDRLPWLYEARVLEGDALQELGRERFESGDNAGAAEAFDGAEEALRRAAELGRSDPAPFRGLCDLGLRRAELGLFGSGGNLEDLVRTFLPECEEATAADPGDVRALLGMSALWIRLAEWRLEREEDPSEALDRTEEAARRAMVLNPDDAEAPTRLASAAVLKAQYLAGSGRDPTEDLDRAITWFEQALKHEPGRIEALSNLGKAHWLEAAWAANDGRDPREEFQQAVAVLERAVEAAPDNALVRNNLGAVWYEKAAWEMEHDLDARISLRRATEELAAARSISPGLVLPSFNLAWIYGVLGQQELKHGRDPMPSWDRSIEAYDRCLEIQPDHAGALRRSISLRFDRASFLREHGGDPLPDLDAAIVAAERLGRVRPDSAVPGRILGTALLRRFAADPERKEDFDRARVLLLDAVRETPKVVEVVERWFETLSADSAGVADRIERLIGELRAETRSGG